MIKELRKRFIIITMVSVVLVLAALIAGINLFNYMSRSKSLDSLLAYLMENGGDFPERKGPRQDMEGEQGMEERGPFPRRPLGTEPELSEEAPFETRFFSVRMLEDGSLIAVNTGKIAAVSSEDAARLAQSLLLSGKTYGFHGNYKYLGEKDEDGSFLYVFLDCTRDIESLRSFFMNSLVVSLIGTGGICILVVLLSRRAMRPIEENERKQKQFITNAGHELKTPLAVIDSCADVLALNEEPEQGKWVKGIKEQVKRMSGLISGLVELSRMDEGGVRLEKAEFSLSDALDSVLEPFRIMSEYQGPALEEDIQENVFYLGDERLIRQLISILADNAMKYTPRDGTVCFTLRKKGRSIQLTEENTVLSMTPGRKDVLFDRFYRGDESHSSKTGGYGIGLSMARSIAEAHGGRIEAVSPHGDTILFSLHL